MLPFDVMVLKNAVQLIPEAGKGQSTPEMTQMKRYHQRSVSNLNNVIKTKRLKS